MLKMAENLLKPINSRMVTKINVAKCQLKIKSSRVTKDGKKQNAI